MRDLKKYEVIEVANGYLVRPLADVARQLGYEQSKTWVFQDGDGKDSEAKLAEFFNEKCRRFEDD